MKKKKLNIYVIVAIILINITFWGIEKSNIIYFKQKKIILDYIEERYNVKPNIDYIQKINNIDNNKYVYYVNMNYADNDFTAYIYDNGTITDNYMQLKLGREIYDNMSNGVENSFSTTILKTKDLNYAYISYYNSLSENATFKDILIDNTLSKDSTLNELLGYDSTHLSLYLVMKNTNFSDIELLNQLYNWINGYAKTNSIEYLSMTIDFIDEENCKIVEKKQDDTNYTRRYIYFSDLNTSNFSKEDLKGTIYTTEDYKTYTAPLEDN